METIKVKGIVLKAADSKEKDKLLHIFTLEKGLVLAKLKGVKNQGAKLKIFSQPFCVAEFILADKNGFYTITNCDVIETFFDVTKDYDRFLIACKFVDAIRKSIIMLEGSEKAAFVFLLKALRELTYSSVDGGLVELKFLCDLVKVCGYKVNLKECLGCFTPFKENKILLCYDDYSFYCEGCAPQQSEEFDRAAHKLLSVIDEVEYDRLLSLKINGLTLSIALTFIRKFAEKNLMVSLLKC